MTLPFDMFDEALAEAEAAKARTLENVYHKGQQLAWNGKQVLAELIDTHGPIRLPPEQTEALRALFAVILWGELSAWKVSAALADALVPLQAKLAATSQAHDEARHFYVMHDYLAHLGPVPRNLGPRTTRVLSGTLRARTLPKKLLGMQLMIEPMALALFQMVREARIEPVLSALLRLYERDEARHVALGVLHLPRMIRGMSRRQAADLWTWQFGELWHQIEMLRELSPHFEALGIDPRRAVAIGRAKQIRANQLLATEMGVPHPLLQAFVRFFDAKVAWHWPQDAGALGRLAGAARAAAGSTGIRPSHVGLDGAF